MDAAWAAGIRWFDTADAYGGGRSESFIGRWRADRQPEGLLVTTKVFNPVDGRPGRPRPRARPDPAQRRGQPRAARRRPHRPLPRPRPRPGHAARRDGRGVRGARRRGHDRRLGPQQLRRGRHRGGARARPPGARPELVLAARPRGRGGVLPLCAEHGIAYVPFGPLVRRLARRASTRAAPASPPGSRMTMRPEPYEHLVDDRVFDGLDALAAEAAERGVSHGGARVRLGALAPGRHRRRLRARRGRRTSSRARGARACSSRRTSATA